MPRSSRQYTCAEVGFWNDPTHREFARAVGNPLGAAYIMRLREFVLTAGHRGHLPAKYTDKHIASAVEFTGPPKKLIRAFKDATVLVRGRRGGYRYVDWPNTPTGWWEEKRFKDALRKAVDRAEADSGDDSVRGQSADIHRTSTEKERSSKQASTDAPPAPPPGGDIAATRLAWTEENFPLGIVDPDETRELLGALSEAEWERFKHATLSRYLKKNPSFVPQVEKCLRKRLYMLVKPPKKRQKATEAQPAAQNGTPGNGTDPRLHFIRLEEIKKRLRSKGLSGEELETRASEELERTEAVH